MSASRVCYSTRDHRTKGMIGYNDYYEDERPNYVFVDELGRPVNKYVLYMLNFGNGCSSFPQQGEAISRRVWSEEA